MPSTLKIRVATEKDVPAILEIINHEIMNGTVVYYYHERTLEQQLEWFKNKQGDAMPILVAEENGVVMGYGTYGIYRPWDAYQYSVEHSIYVSHKARGKGIGKALMKELITLAKEQGYHTMIAGVDAENKGSYRFHQAFGFKEVGRFNEVGYKFNRWLDLIFMQLFLSD